MASRFHIYKLSCLLLLLQCHLHVTEGTTCLQCDSIPFTKEVSTCTKEVTCPGAQICFVSLFVNDTGQANHRTGCSEQQLCTEENTVDPGLVGKRDTSICRRCCQGDNCNNQSCRTSDTEHCSDWEKWTPCDVICGGGKQTRARECKRGSLQTTKYDTRDCNTKACPGVHSVCSDTLDDCSSPEIKQTMCSTESLAYKYCQKTCGLCPVDGQWSSWSAWSACTASCGSDAHKLRLRLCNNPAPKNNGSNCVGHGRERQDCHTLCPVDGGWSNWTVFAACGVSCGDGTMALQRTCTSPAPAHGGKQCTGDSFKTTVCHLSPCPVDGAWSMWTLWSACSVSCGNGVKTRNRTCDHPRPEPGGHPCNGSSVETHGCRDAICSKIDGGWSDWSKWTGCSATCGGGQTFRFRTCSSPVPQNGGKPCENAAHFKESKSCGTKDCPVDGNWADWSPWHQCSVTCGGGTTFRSRTCSNPVPKNGGEACENPSAFLERTTCGQTSCVDSGLASATTPLTTDMTTLSMTSSAFTPMPSLVPSVGCNDQSFCGDSHIRPIVCQDVYVATTYCPKLCGICGATSAPPPCMDSVGGSCSDPLYIQFACSDNELAALCAKTCGVCH